MKANLAQLTKAVGTVKTAKIQQNLERFKKYMSNWRKNIEGDSTQEELLTALEESAAAIEPQLSFFSKQIEPDVHKK